jgi:ribonuclease E
MSNADKPAGTSGGTAATPASNPLTDLPERIRVHALAKLLGSSSRIVLATLADLGVTARSAQSSVPREVALQVGTALGAEQLEAVPGATTEPATEVAAEQEQAPEQEQQAPAEPEQVSPEQPKETERTTAAASTADLTREQRSEPATAARPAHTPLFAAPSPVFLPPEPVEQATTGSAPATGKPSRSKRPADEAEQVETPTVDTDNDADSENDNDTEGGGRRRRRRGRRGRGRGKGTEDAAGESAENQSAGDETDETDQTAGSGGRDKRDRAKGGKVQAEPDKTDKPDQEKSDQDKDKSGESEKPGETDDGSDENDSASKRRRRRRRRKGGDDDTSSGEQTADDPPNTVVHVRDSKTEGEKARDAVRSVRGSTRLEAKRQRRRDGREAGRRRAPILSEAEFLARRESVDRTMVVAEKNDSTQIGVLEDGVLVEHFVTSSGSGSIVGNVYLGRVQNVLPSMEAAFIDIGRGRNAVLYAGEVDWDAAGLEGKARKIEQALSTGDSVLVQVTKDPVGHKGARLTTQISLPGRFLVYVPAGGATGISRKLPETERRRLKDILKRIVPEDAGVIIRTASEGVSEDELERDVRRLKAQWEVIKEKAEAGQNAGKKKSAAPVLLYEEPDLLIKVVRDLFTEDFSKLEIQGDTAWETIHAYVQHVAPDLADRLKRYVGTGDVFAEHRIDEQLTKALDRKVWLPSGGYLVIDRTEAMTVIDVNTGKFTGSGGNLEETVTRNNLESAEEIVRQLRLRDIGGIIVIDFIDMVLESNRDLVLRRLTECLGRDRTRHQVAEVTSLGLVQMTRKRVGTGLLEAFSAPCEHCKGRGVVVSTEPQRGNGGSNGHNHTGGHQHGGRRSRGGRGKGEDSGAHTEQNAAGPTPEQRESVVTAVQAMANASRASEDDETEPVGSDSAEPASNGQAPAESQPAGDRREQERGEAASTSVPPSGTADPPEKTTDPEPHTASGISAAPVGGEHAGGEQAEAAPVTRSRRRARRAASRPAGPPVQAPEQP